MNKDERIEYKSYRKPLNLRVKDAFRRVLKDSLFGHYLYPFFQRCWRAYIIPKRQRMLQKYGPQVIARLHQLLTDARITYYADGGTLLGFIRDKGFIKHDDDMDISIHPGTATPSKVLRVFLDAGYGFLHGFCYEDKVVEFSVMDVSGVSIDVFFPSKMNKPGRVHGHHPIWDPARTYPNERANTLYEFEFAEASGFKTVQILDVDVVVPENAEEILTTEYGPWQVPDSKFNNITDRIFRELPGYAFRVEKEDILRGEYSNG